MMEAGDDRINVWMPSDLPGLELRRGFGVARPVPRHWHEEYQLCLIEAGPGELTYRGATHATPPASLFVVHPGETHSNRAHQLDGCSYRTLFIDPATVRRAASDLAGRERGVPFFPSTVIFDARVLSSFRRLHTSLESPASPLERQTLFSSFIGLLIARFAEQPCPAAPRTVRREGIERACEYLTELYSENVSLEQLARIAGLSAFHFSRLFTERTGMPPHAFQTQVRVARAKALLREGLPISHVAAQTGFADQSHLTRHFKRLVGITPGRFRQGSKNVQDAPANEG